MGKKEISAGGIVLRERNGVSEVLLIKDRFGFVTWPKGHIEKGESPEDAALREINEETGLQTLDIIAKVEEQVYTFERNDDIVDKKVYIFLITAVPGEELVPQLSEINDCFWVPADEASGRVGYGGSDKIVKKALELYHRNMEND